MKRNRQGGFVGLLIMLVVALALAKYYWDWSFADFIHSHGVAEILSYLKKFILLVWDKFLVGPVVFIWNSVVVDILWKGLVSFFDMIKGWVDSNS